MSLALTQTVAPVAEPVSLAEVKEYLNYEETAREPEIKRLIAAAREQYESDTRIQLVTATYTLELDRFPAGVIELPRPPLSGITSIAYTDENGDAQTWDASKYQTDTSSWPGRVLPTAAEVTWPSTEIGTINAVTITFTAGFGAATAVPPNHKNAIKAMVWTGFEHPGATSERKLFKHPYAYDSVVSSERVVSFGSR
jgi:uncharacterized phiE125 gp8 family phage protein